MAQCSSIRLRQWVPVRMASSRHHTRHSLGLVPVETAVIALSNVSFGGNLLRCGADLIRLVIVGQKPRPCDDIAPGAGRTAAGVFYDGEGAHSGVVLPSADPGLCPLSIIFDRDADPTR